MSDQLIEDAYLLLSDKANIAIIISVFALIIAGMSAMYTRRLAKNDTARMKRKKPIFEISLKDPATPEGWRPIWIICRNLEPVAIQIIGATAKSRKGLLATWEDVTDSRRNSFFPPTPRSSIIGSKAILISRTVQPHGTKPAPAANGQSARFSNFPTDTVKLEFYAKDITKQSEVEIIWEWADGQKT